MTLSPKAGISGGAGLSPTAGTGSGGLSAAPASPSYTGPLDLVPLSKIAYAVRALCATWLWQPLFRLRRSANGAEMDFNADGVTGAAPQAEIATWLEGFYGATAIEIAAGGTGYSAFDFVLLTGGTFSNPVAVLIFSVDGAGTPDFIGISGAGLYSVTPESPVSVSGGSGTGLTLNVTFSPASSPARLVTFYDQSGNGIDYTAATEGAQAYYEIAANGKPSFRSANNFAETAETIDITNGLSALMVSANNEFTGGRLSLNAGGGIYCLLLGGVRASIDMQGPDGRAGGDYAGALADGDYVETFTVEYGNNSYSVNGVTAPENNVYDETGAVGLLADLHFSFEDDGAFITHMQETIVWEGIKSLASSSDNASNYYAP